MRMKFTTGLKKNGLLKKKVNDKDERPEKGKSGERKGKELQGKILRHKLMMESYKNAAKGLKQIEKQVKKQPKKAKKEKRSKSR